MILNVIDAMNDAYLTICVCGFSSVVLKKLSGRRYFSQIFLVTKICMIIKEFSGKCFQVVTTEDI